MSADYYFPGTPKGDIPADYEENLNITYNLSPMLREAGFPAHSAMTGAPCSEAGPIFARTAARLREDPTRFSAMNPQNGWGDYVGAVEFCERGAALCERYFDAFIGTWL